MTDLVFVSVDFDQIEARIMTNLCLEPTFITAFQSDLDFFVGVARKVYKDDTIEKPDSRRKTTKNYLYSLLFGGGIAKMAKVAGVSYSEMKRHDRKFSRDLGVMHDWRKKVINDAKEISKLGLQPYTMTKLGGRRLYTQPGKEYQLVNYQIQGTATEYLQESALRAKREGLFDYMRLFIHDEILSVVPRDEAVEYGEAMQRCMMFDTDPIPLTAEYQIIENRWGAAYE